MASFPQSWQRSEHAQLGSSGLVATKASARPVAVSLVADSCIPAKHIIMSSSVSTADSDPGSRAEYSRSDSGIPSLGVRIDSSSGVPNSASKVRLAGAGAGAAGGSSPSTRSDGGDGSIVPAGTSASSDSFLDEMGVSRSSLRRLTVEAIACPIYYFEITPVSDLTSTDTSGGVAVGLSSVEAVQTCGMDQCPLNIGYHSSGRFIHEEQIPINNEGGFGQYDTIGCGLEIGGQGRVFFTCNGHVVGATVFSGFGIQGESYFPVILLQGTGTSVRTNFGASALQFRSTGLNICNYAFAFNNDAIMLSKTTDSADKLGSGEISVSAAAGEFPDDDDLDEVTHPRQATWGPRDVTTLQSALQMLEQIGRVQAERLAGPGRGRDAALGADMLLDQALLDSYQDVFHLKIQRALSSGLKTLSDLVQNDGLALELQQRVPTSSGAPSSPAASSSDTSATSPVAASPLTGSRHSDKGPRKPSKSTIDMVQMITNAMRPVWQKMLDLISQSLVEPPSPGLDLGALLVLNDRITATITEMENLFHLSLPRAENRAASGGGGGGEPGTRRDRGFTDPTLGASPLHSNSNSMFSWPGRLSISVYGDTSPRSSHASATEDHFDAHDDPSLPPDDGYDEGGDLGHYSDFDALSSPSGSWPTPREPGAGVDGFPAAVPKVRLTRQGTRTQVALPSLHELMTNLRRGSAEDVARVADLIYHLFSDMAGYRRRSNSTCPSLHSSAEGMHKVHCSLIKNIVEQGGLLVLLQALARCAEWPEVEIKVSRAVTVLTTCETDYYLMLRKSDEIITAMNLLLLKGGGAPVAPLEGELHEDSATDSSAHSATDHSSHQPRERERGSRARGRDHIYPNPSDESIFQELVAMAVGNICSVIQNHWEEESLALVEGLGLDTASVVSRQSTRSGSSTSTTHHFRFPEFSNKPKTPSADVMPPFPPPALALHRSRSGGNNKSIDNRAPSNGNAQTLIRCVESVLHIVATLMKPPPPPQKEARSRSSSSPEGPTVHVHGNDFGRVTSDSGTPLYIPGGEKELFSKTAVLCCRAVCSLTQVSPLKQLVVERRGMQAEEGILDMLVAWVDHCADQVAAASAAAAEGGQAPLHPLLFELLESVACAIAALCKVDRLGAAHHGSGDFDMSGTSEYAVGVIDAQMKAVNVPAVIVKFVQSISPDFFTEPKMGVNQRQSASPKGVGGSPRTADRSVYPAPAAAAEAGSEPPPPLLLPYPLLVPSWCSFALMRSTSVHFAEALNSMTCRQTNRTPVITAAFCSIMLTAAAQTTRHKRSRVNFEHPTEEYGPEKLQQMHARDLEDDCHLGKVAVSCINGLCSFVYDALNTAPSLSPPPLGHAFGHTHGQRSGRGEQDGETLPLVVREIMSFNVLDTLKLVATLPMGEARLAAFRLMSMVSEWRTCLEKMIDMNITEILISYLKDLEDSNEWSLKVGSGNPGASPTAGSGITMSTPFSLQKPRSERGISTDSVRSVPSETDGTSGAGAGAGSNAPLALEELMRVLFFISQVCEHSFQNASRLYDEGLMRVMLNLIKHYRKNAEVHRQALRSISAMCPVLSSITPGGHPAQVIEKLTSAKDSAEIHMVKGKKQNAARRESAKTRLEFNLLIFVEALRALAHSLLSPSSLVQKEALRGISLLAVDDQLRVGIVEGPLKQVIRIFVDPSTEQDLKDLAEQVFVNIGFHNGSKDLEIVANDSGLLSDWFYMKRSMRPQALAFDLTRHWIDALFYGDEMAERRARRQFMLAELGRSDDHVSDESDSLSLRLPGGLAIDLRDTLDLPGLDVLKGMLEKLVLPQGSDERQPGGLYWGSSAVGGPAGTGDHSGLRDALHQQFLFLFDSWQMLNQMYFADHSANDQHHVQNQTSLLHSPYYDVLPAAGSKLRSNPSVHILSTTAKKKSGVSLFSDTFFRYINHCSSRLSAQRILAEEENERLEREFEAERLLMGPLSAITSDTSFHSPPYHAGKASHGHTPNKNPEVRPIRKKQVSFSAAPPGGAPPLIALNDGLANRVVELLDYIFPSKMFQLYLFDLISCGSNNRHDEDFSIPRPRQFRALLLPPREYESFHREGRIIERILDDIKTKGYQSEKPTFDYTASVLNFGSNGNSNGNGNSSGNGNGNTAYDGNAGKSASTSTNNLAAGFGSSVLWAISFRDSKFEGEFFATFSNTLHKCPSISTLNFAMKNPTLDSRLGYLAGNVPTTVHFLTFENALSSDSLQIMCVLLRTQNAAWQRDCSRSSRSSSGAKAYYRGKRDDAKTKAPSMSGGMSGSDRGLFGLTIRLHSLSDEDVKHLAELLDPLGESNSAPSAAAAAEYSMYKSPAQKNSKASATSSPIQTVTATVIDAESGSDSALGEEATAVHSSDEGSAAAGNRGGLKYLDLSDNRLSDAQCGEILKSSAFGPLEGLELGGNLIQRGLYFISSLQSVLAHRHVALKHLGVSFCGLPVKSFVGILACVSHADYPSLTSLDVSSNSLTHTPEVKESIHYLLKRNRTLRIIDLSDNSFNNETIRAINLGLLENESTVLLLKISLNATMKAQELAYVREKLWRNREQYSIARSAPHHPQGVTHRHGSIGNEAGLNDSGGNNGNNSSSNSLDFTSGAGPGMALDTADAEIIISQSNSMPLSLPAALPVGCMPGMSMSRESSTSSNALSLSLSGDGNTGGVLSPMRRSTSDLQLAGLHPGSRTSSKDSASDKRSLYSSANSAASATLAAGERSPAAAKASKARQLSTDHIGRSVSNPFITVSDKGEGRRRSGTGVSSRAEAMEAVSRFAEDGTATLPQLSVANVATATANAALPTSASGIAFRSIPAVESSGSLEAYSGTPYSPYVGSGADIEAGLVQDAYPAAAAAVSEEAAVLEASQLQGQGQGQGQEGEDAKDGAKADSAYSHSSYVMDEELNHSTRSMNSVGSEFSHSQSLPEGVSKELWVLFSAPLAWRDAQSGVLRPIEMLNYKSEKDTLWQVFREGQRDIDLHFNFATTDQLRSAVTLGCKALHFSGHGHPDWLNFEDGRSGLQIVTVERLEKLCSAGGIKLDFVFVSACYSRNAGEAFAAAGVKHVVCVSVDAQLLDTAATIFTRAFYLALVVGENVDKAFEIGQNAVAASPSVPSSMHEQDKFLLLPQDKPHDVPIFKAPGIPRWPPENSSAVRWEERLLPDYLPEPPEDFEGREVDMYEVITALYKRHLVSIVGERGVGKSAVAVASMRYLTERNVFEDGAVYVRLQHVTTYEGFLETFQRVLTSTCPVAAEKLHLLISSIQQDGDAPGAADTSSNRYKKNPLFTQEDLLITCVSSLKLLIVFDHANSLLTAGEVGADVTMFLGNLLEGRRNIRVRNHNVIF
jgi:hypothetical protein